MSETLNAYIIDVASGEVTERPFTAAEIRTHQATQEQLAERQAEAEAKAQARESALAKLKALGLTQEEISAL